MSLELPDDLPVPMDDGSAKHLTGMRLPDVALPATDGRAVRLDQAGSPWLIVYAYPRTGRPDEPPLVKDWDQIPGARGCTPESCGFKNHHAELAALGAEVYGLSTQTTEYQREVVGRLGLPFALLSDADLKLKNALDLPAFLVGGELLLKRFTFAARDGVIEHVWYPVFPPDTHAAEVLAWLDSPL
ncbi:MAG: peroxiredoxin [Actinomycetota bacterium]